MKNEIYIDIIDVMFHDEYNPIDNNVLIVKHGTFLLRS